MGADFFLCTLEIKHSKSVALAKAKDLNLTKDDFHAFEDAGIWLDETLTDAELVKEMRTRLLEAVEAVYSASQRRDCSYFYVDGDRVFYATGGTSWGESPSGVWDDFCLVQQYSKEILE